MNFLLSAHSDLRVELQQVRLLPGERLDAAGHAAEAREAVHEGLVRLPDLAQVTSRLPHGDATLPFLLRALSSQGSGLDVPGPLDKRRGAC